MNEIGAEVFFGREYNKLVGLIKCPTQHFDYNILNNLVNMEAFHYRFTIVRHPVEKLKSDFIWSTRTLKQNERPTFADWFENCQRQFQKNKYFLDNHIRPQVEFVGPDVKVYKYEDGLNSIVKNIFSDLRISLDKDIDIPLLNTSAEYLKDGQRSRDVIVLDSEMKKIREIYARDFEMFEYQ
jgi:hypothetical protein